jgi:hypothetical protein
MIFGDDMKDISTTTCSLPLSDLIVIWRVGTHVPKPNSARRNELLDSARWRVSLWHRSSTTWRFPTLQPRCTVLDAIRRQQASRWHRLRACTKLVGGHRLELHLRRHVVLKSRTNPSVSVTSTITCMIAIHNHKNQSTRRIP